LQLANIRLNIFTFPHYGFIIIITVVIIAGMAQGTNFPSPTSQAKVLTVGRGLGSKRKSTSPVC